MNLPKDSPPEIWRCWAIIFMNPGAIDTYPLETPLETELPELKAEDRLLNLFELDTPLRAESRG